MNDPLDVLREEHTVIRRGLDLLEAAAAREEAGAGPGERWWGDVLAWFGAFADRTHHAKEETALFPAMIRLGAAEEGGPIRVMLEEHFDGRALLAAIAGSDRPRAARRYAAFLRDHIEKEDVVVFLLAEAILDEPALTWIADRFDTVDAAEGGHASLDSARRAMDRLEAALAAPAA